MPGSDDFNSNWHSSPKLQRLAVWFLAIISLFIVIFWIWQVRSQLNSPFSYKTMPAEQSNSLGGSSATSSAASIKLLKRTDTDGDGLSDYDELYVYHTSPYLTDSDSDGISDFKEIKQGTDPNCPIGQTCSGSNARSILATSSVPAFSEIPNLSNISASPSSVTTSSSATNTLDKAALQQVLNGQADASTLRQVLIATGAATAAQLQNISDQDLLRSYQQTLNSNQATSTSAGASNSATSSQ